MEKRTEKLLHILKELDFGSISKTQIELLSKEASGILLDEFRKEVIGVFENSLDWYPSFKKAVIGKDKANFVSQGLYANKGKDFINDNFDKVDLMIQILNEHIATEGENENE